MGRGLVELFTGMLYIILTVWSPHCVPTSIATAVWELCCSQCKMCYLSSSMT